MQAIILCWTVLCCYTVELTRLEDYNTYILFRYLGIKLLL